MTTSLFQFRSRMDGELLSYAAWKLSMIRPEVVPNREEDATEDANADARPASSASSAPSGAYPRAELYAELGGAAAGDLDAEMSQPRPTENCSLFEARELFVTTMRREPTPVEWFSMRLADARRNKNRNVRCERYYSRVDSHLVHSIRVDDRRGNFKESLGAFTDADCPLCVTETKEA